MNFEVILTESFKNEAKKLSKKYKSLKTDLEELFAKLEVEPTYGTPLGHDVYKIRLAIKFKGKGKSGGARVISLVRIVKERVYLVAIYNKSEQKSISQKDIMDLLRNDDLL